MCVYQFPKIVNIFEFAEFYGEKYANVFFDNMVKKSYICINVKDVA